MNWGYSTYRLPIHCFCQLSTWVEPSMNVGRIPPVKPNRKLKSIITHAQISHQIDCHVNILQLPVQKIWCFV